jgi:hypothetical protein
MCPHQGLLIGVIFRYYNSHNYPLHQRNFINTKNKLMFNFFRIRPLGSEYWLIYLSGENIRGENWTPGLMTKKPNRMKLFDNIQRTHIIKKPALLW